MAIKEKNYIPYLLACVAEECGEIQQMVGKSLRFGLDDTNPKTGEVNLELLDKEILDLIEVVRMLYLKIDRPFFLDENHMAKKRDKVIKYYRQYHE